MLPRQLEPTLPARQASLPDEIVSFTWHHGSA
jgi:hypothetical protein